ncbi:hypothetical protein J2067_003553 [Erwinia rhapontici]|nr:hypothetical protein [Erwinia rhapontici]
MPRIGSFASSGRVGSGCFATGGSGVTSDFGGSEEQLNSNSAAIASAADLLRAMTAGIRRERVMVCSGSF